MFDVKGRMLLQFPPLTARECSLVQFASYRFPMAVTEIMLIPDGFGSSGYYLCPRCHITLDREFVAFCDRCGQRLDWENYEQAKVVRPEDR